MAKTKKKKSRSSKRPRTPSILTAPRNPYWDHPLMAKGGIHQKSKSAERAKIRRETKQLARDWSKSSLIRQILLKCPS